MDKMMAPVRRRIIEDHLNRSKGYGTYPPRKKVEAQLVHRSGHILQEKRSAPKTDKTDRQRSMADAQRGMSYDLSSLRQRARPPRRDGSRRLNLQRPPCDGGLLRSAIACASAAGEEPYS